VAQASRWNVALVGSQSPNKKSITLDLRPDDAHQMVKMDAFRKCCLLEGLDEISLTLAKSDAIRRYEASWLDSEPSLLR
jgi:3-isopropylmalate dehydratase small subunit